nr:translation initiation factor IF-2-like [Aegilops tauschii subsp. strangulata]
MAVNASSAGPVCSRPRARVAQSVRMHRRELAATLHPRLRARAAAASSPPRSTPACSSSVRVHRRPVARPALPQPRRRPPASPHPPRTVRQGRRARGDARHEAGAPTTTPEAEWDGAERDGAGRGGAGRAGGEAEQDEAGWVRRRARRGARHRRRARRRAGVVSPAQRRRTRGQGRGAAARGGMACAWASSAAGAGASSAAGGACASRGKGCSSGGRALGAGTGGELRRARDGGVWGGPFGVKATHAALGTPSARTSALFDTQTDKCGRPDGVARWSWPDS